MLSRIIKPLMLHFEVVNKTLEEISHILHSQQRHAHLIYSSCNLIIYNPGKKSWEQVLLPSFGNEKNVAHSYRDIQLINGTLTDL